ncbi:unnamed protein product [Haemonchus placei]|uniref:Beta-glucosidase n=1 Tax=Haemonchus placei TaxID=6290 RepID=A0A0N4WDK6_HAEPC|nr:unnamed protein product [Haemonchus placei]
MVSVVLQPATKPHNHLVGGQLYDVPDTTGYNSLEDFHAVREQANWTLAIAVIRSSELPFSSWRSSCFVASS